MPISGLTTQPITNITHTQPIVARIYKGEPKTDPKRPGKELSYFRIAVKPQFRQYEPMIKQIFGAEPTELRGMYLGGHTTDTAFTAFYREWNATGLVRECTGEYQTRAFDPNHGRVVESGQPCLRNGKNKCGCKQEANFNFLCPAFSEHAKILGVFRFTTHSIIDIKSMYEALSGIQILYGTLYGVPLVLSRMMEEVSYPDPETKQRKNAKHHFVKVRVDEDFVGHMGVQNWLSTGILPIPQLPTNGKPALPQSVASVQTEASAQTETSWITTNGNLKRLLGWAGKNFNLQENEVFDALHWDDTTINDFGDYTGDFIRASAAVIAYAAGWDANKIDKYCADTGVVFSYRANETKAVANEIVLKVAEEFGADPIPDEPDTIIIADD